MPTENPLGTTRFPLKGVVEPKRAKKASPLAPAGGAGAFPDFTYNGGPVINTPRVYALFVGDWSSTANQARANRLSQFLIDLLSSNYMNILSQYGCGTAGTLYNSVFIANTNNNLSATDIHQLVQTAIDKGTIPEPRHVSHKKILYREQVYVLYLDDTTAVNDTLAGAVMCEANSDTAFGYHDFFTTSAGNTCYFAVVPGLADACLKNSCSNDDAGCTLRLAQTQEQRQTQVTSHELAEMISDPLVGSNEAWTRPGSPHENGDICKGESGTITVGPNTWTVQLMYSKTDDTNSNGAKHCLPSAASPIPRISGGPGGRAANEAANLILLHAGRSALTSSAKMTQACLVGLTLLG
jgi:hypothetical protein